MIDNLELLVDQNEDERFADERSLSGKIEELFARDLISAQALNFIRGRSVTKTYLIIDEAQNLTPRQVKGIITRVGKGTKVAGGSRGTRPRSHHPVLAAPGATGLTYASARMRGSPLCAQLTMLPDECERSALALDAAMRM